MLLGELKASNSKALRVYMTTPTLQYDYTYLARILLYDYTYLAYSYIII